MGVAKRIADRKRLCLVNGFLRAGIVKQHGGFAASHSTICARVPDMSTNSFQTFPGN